MVWFLLCAISLPVRAQTANPLTPEQQLWLTSTTEAIEQALKDSIELRQLLKQQREKSSDWEERWQQASATVIDLQAKLTDWESALSSWGSSSAEVRSSVERLSRDLSTVRRSLDASRADYARLSGTFASYRAAEQERIDAADRETSRWRLTGILAIIAAVIGWLVAIVT